MTRVCERCAGDDDDLVLVRPGDAPGPGASAGTADGELWCFECRSTAAHVEVDDRG